MKISSLLGTSLDAKSATEAVSFNVKAKLEEKERRSQMVNVGFALLLTSKPSVVKFEIEGIATLNGKDEDIRKTLEVDSETRVPRVLPRIYQHAFTAMYLLSTILNTPPPPQDLLGPYHQPSPAEDVTVEVNAGTAKPVEVAAPAPQTEIAKDSKAQTAVSATSNPSNT